MRLLTCANWFFGKLSSGNGLASVSFFQLPFTVIRPVSLQGCCERATLTNERKIMAEKRWRNNFIALFFRNLLVGEPVKNMDFYFCFCFRNAADQGFIRFIVS